ncbi:DUF1254 domain-containing protein [Brucella pituitosa]|uniref:DUF1254 domain-containing protein n=1 Tax=Brucella pituitosa TaxID=571256 RepID=UPI002003ABC2|nr:DUF1254 domain-containing protein [Brucella pituitosa]MCK4206847.1 DUF1254 domain-containing protein [Brucella pituitosa]
MSFTFNKSISVSVLMAGLSIASIAQAESIETRIGKIPTQFGLPADQATVEKLYNEMDFQRAVQSYLWALPIVGFAGWQDAQRNVFGAADTDMVIYESVKDKLGILTANATTPYIVGMPDLSKTGPLVIDYPPGASAGGVGDFWQRPIEDMGETGPDKGKGGKYLIVGPGQTPPDAEGYTVVQSPTVNLFFAFRVLDPDPAKGKELISKVRIYPYADRDKPGETRFIQPEGREWSQVPPKGIAYWERLNDILQREPVMERDRFYMAMLKPLGIEKGKPFKPNESQRKLLEEAAVLGEKMAQSLAFDNRDPNARYRSDARWEYLFTFDPGQDVGTYAPLDQRTGYFYQAVTTSRGMVTKTPGVGQAYIGTAHDKDGVWLDGGKSYRLHVPADAPAKLFWSLTVYDTETRAFFDNTPEGIVDRSSRADLKKNADGSVDLFMGPEKPAGHEKNWIPTIPGKAWFALFRFYGPTETYFDQSWKLPDIEKND